MHNISFWWGDSIETMWPYVGSLGSAFCCQSRYVWLIRPQVWLFISNGESVSWFDIEVLLIKQLISSSRKSLCQLWLSASHCANNAMFHKLDLLINQVIIVSQHVIDTLCSRHVQEGVCRPHGEPALASDCKHLIHLHFICLSSATEEAHSRGEWRQRL